MNVLWNFNWILIQFCCCFSNSLFGWWIFHLDCVLLENRSKTPAKWIKRKKWNHYWIQLIQNNGKKSQFCFKQISIVNFDVGIVNHRQDEFNWFFIHAKTNKNWSILFWWNLVTCCFICSLFDQPNVWAFQANMWRYHFLLSCAIHWIWWTWQPSLYHEQKC